MCLILKQNILMILYVKHTIWHISLDEFYRGHRHLNNVMIGEKKKREENCQDPRSFFSWSDITSPKATITLTSIIRN